MKAQLILVGGRLIPNILSIIYHQPELIVGICSLQSHKREWPQLKKAIQNLLPLCQIEEKITDGYQLDQIETACESSLGDLTKRSWVFNITNATSIMSIGAYNVAKKHSQDVPIPCWFLDTPRNRVIALVGEPAKKNIFQLKVEQYIAAHDCQLVPGSLDEEREYTEKHWLPFAKILVKNPNNIDILKKFIGKISNQKPKKEEGAQELNIPDSSEEMRSFLSLTRDFELITNLRREKGRIFFSITYLQANYLEGSWLEAYVWSEARQLDIFSDCLWNQRLITGNQPIDNDSKNELDVAMIYKAQLFIVECKTGKHDGFDSDILYKLDSIANPLGNWSVGKMLVSSLRIPEKSRKRDYDLFKKFEQKAEERGISLVMRDTLPNVGVMLRKLAEESKFNR